MSARGFGTRAWLIVKNLVRGMARKCGFDIVRFDLARPGRDPYADMRRLVRNPDPLILDVGANAGQSIHRFRSCFPHCVVHSFEPSPATFEILKRNVAAMEGVSIWNCALGSMEGRQPLFENSFSDMSSFLPLGEAGWGQVARETVVEVRTVDQFCRQEGIDRIDILKTDTQGFDLEVLKGAEKTLAANRVRLVYLEITFSDMYVGLPSLGQIYDFLQSRGFLLVSFYHIFYQGSLAAWTDALFISREHYQSGA